MPDPERKTPPLGSRMSGATVDRSAMSGVALTDRTPVRTSLKVLAVLLAAAFSLGGLYYAVLAHERDTVRHLDPAVVREKGGPVYKEDLREAQQAIEKTIAGESEKTRAVVQRHVDRPIACERAGRGGLLCRVSEEP